MRIRKIWVVFSLFLCGNFVFAADSVIEIYDISNEWLYEASINYHDQPPLTWGEKLALPHAGKAKLSVAGGITCAILGTLPTGLGCGLKQTTVCIIMGCLLSPIGALGVGSSVVFLGYFSYQAIKTAAEINLDREKHYAIAHLLRECSRDNRCEIINDEFQTLLPQANIKTILKQFAENAPDHPMKPEELRKRLKLAALAGYLIPKEHIANMEESEKDALTMGKWATCDALKLVSHLAFSPEANIVFEEEAQNNANAINEAIKIHCNKIAQAEERAAHQEETRRAKIATQRALVESD